MTTLEVLCATALAAMLMTAVLSVISGLTQRERTLASRDATPAWARQLESLLHRDLLLAERIDFLPNGFRVEGPLAQDRRTGAATWQQSRVVYHVASSPAGQTLLRTETTNPLITTTGQTEAVCFDVRQLELILGDGESNNFLSPSRDAETPVVIVGERGPIPRRAQLRLWTADAEGPVIDAEFHRPY